VAILVASVSGGLFPEALEPLRNAASGRGICRR
jgi:hypothetical protein